MYLAIRRVTKLKNTQKPEQELQTFQRGGHYSEVVKWWPLLILSLKLRWTRKADRWDWWKWSWNDRCQGLILFHFGQGVSKISTPKESGGELIKGPGPRQKCRDRIWVEGSLWHKQAEPRQQQSLERRQSDPTVEVSGLTDTCVVCPGSSWWWWWFN